MIREIYPDKEVRAYILQLFASCLEITALDKTLYIFIGDKDNGKTCMFDFIKAAFGADKLYTDTEASILVKAFDTVGKPCPELMEWKNKRLIVSSETDRKDYLSQAFVKNITGSSSIKMRGLYQHKREIIERAYKIFVQTNFFPKFEPDVATESRILAIPHEATFFRAGSPEFNPKNPNHHWQDSRLCGNFQHGHQH